MACERYEAAVKAAPRRRLDPLGNRLLILQWSSPPYAMARIWAFCRRKPPFLLQKHRILASSSRVGSAPATGSPNSCHRAPLEARAHTEKPFFATERYSVLNYAARFALSNRCRAFARRYEVGLREAFVAAVSRVLFRIICVSKYNHFRRLPTSVGTTSLGLCHLSENLLPCW